MMLFASKQVAAVIASSLQRFAQLHNSVFQRRDVIGMRRNFLNVGSRANLKRHELKSTVRKTQRKKQTKEETNLGGRCGSRVGEAKAISARGFGDERKGALGLFGSVQLVVLRTVHAHFDFLLASNHNLEEQVRSLVLLKLLVNTLFLAFQT
jgi:hypothetical protein